MSDKTADMLAAAKEFYTAKYKEWNKETSWFEDLNIPGVMADFALSVTAQQAQQIEDLTREVARLRKLNEPIWDERNSE